MRNLKLLRGGKLRIERIDRTIEEMQPCQEVVIPLTNRTGHTLNVLVQPGDRVRLGEIIAEHPRNRLCPVRSSVSGKVASVLPLRCIPWGNVLTAVIHADRTDDRAEDLKPNPDFLAFGPDLLWSILKKAGVDLIHFGYEPRPGRAIPPPEPPPMDEKQFVADLNPETAEATPSANLEPPPTVTGPSPAPPIYYPELRHYDTLIISALDPYPPSTIEGQLVINRADDLTEGIRLVTRLFQPNHCIVAVDRDQERTVRVAENAMIDQVEKVVALRGAYPMAHEKLLIKEILDREIPSPTDGTTPETGILVLRISALMAAVDAVKYGHPMTHTYISVCGHRVQSPKNLMVPIGTPIKDVLSFCDCNPETVEKVVAGGPLKGISHYSLESPITALTPALWVQDPSSIQRGRYQPCISCGACVQICPMRLRPHLLGRYCEFEKFEEAADDFDLFTCISCGCCGHVCPSRRPLVHFFEFAKQELATVRETP